MRLPLTVQDALGSHGMGPEGWARLVCQMAQGYRPALKQDEDSAANPDAPKHRRARLFTAEDGTRCVVVDERTQFKALQLIAEVHGWRKSGVNVNVNTAPGGAAGDNARTLGGMVVLLEGTGNDELVNAIRELPTEQRRKLSTVLLDKCRDSMRMIDAEKGDAPQSEGT